MHLQSFAQYLLCFMGALLIVRVFSLRLNRLYRIFSLYLIGDIAGSFLYLGWRHINMLHAIDYRVLWLASRTVVWALTLWFIYELLTAILQSYPGLLSLSRQVLRYCWIGAIIVSLLFAMWEYQTLAINVYRALPAFARLGFIVERSIAGVSLTAMLATLLFLLWFPVELPRNLLNFSIGFVIYFSLENTLLLARSTLSPQAAHSASTYMGFIAAVCFLYWALVLNRKGEIARSHVQILWNSQQQRQLLEQLEGLNQAMLGAVRR